MKQPKPRGRGRPKLDPSQRFLVRHVVNLSEAIDDAVKRYCDANGVARHTDGMRQLIVKALKAEGLL